MPPKKQPQDRQPRPRPKAASNGGVDLTPGGGDGKPQMFRLFGVELAGAPKLPMVARETWAELWQLETKYVTEDGTVDVDQVDPVDALKVIALRRQFFESVFIGDDRDRFVEIISDARHGVDGDMLAEIMLSILAHYEGGKRPTQPVVPSST